MQRDNSLSLIRLLAALQVMVGHLTHHFNLSLPTPLDNLIGFYNGVPIFFMMSGFLIWFSIERSDSAKHFYSKRFCRIYPELWVAVAVELAILLLLYNGIEWKSFFLFAVGQSTIFQFWTPDSLRGYGLGAPNGSLWTICVIVQFYLIAWPFYKLMKVRQGGYESCGLLD